MNLVDLVVVAVVVAVVGQKRLLIRCRFVLQGCKRYSTLPRGRSVPGSPGIVQRRVEN